MIEILNKELHWIDVEYWFSILNDWSLIYLIIPFFIIELIRYKIQNRLSKDIIFDSVANIITLGGFVLIEYIIGILFATKLYFWVYYNFSLPHLPLNWITIICCVLLADFAYYWDHRMMHRIGIGWATHTVHHSSPHFNMSVAYRFGPLDAVFPLLFSIPIVMLGFDPILVLLSEVFVQVFQTLLHTEIIKKLPKPIEYLFNTPSHHRVHHGSNRQYWDKNYAGILIIWDRLLGTFEPEVETVRYGIDKPINSNNPIVVFFHGLKRLGHKVINTKGIGNKFLCLIKPPGWEPK
ncbi:sterol desaturase family protein [Psychroserpens sp.]|uniref:sterol desaturase family protein n=1 Tax=Psychroserpens sp. TaxID=2020870 RepID=UPI001B0B3F0D|nr:sterol desaturase family protein [Psychroserpens sp.]MBO6606712.1 sterol desaturase family protein [Psychroserpens sp.]MBO6631905.1 sterol desaturase family protein [Psychroserpens sp.]MBO6653416.1 sterol desaturase family protein [Psychroserpens sp.]MBO6680557.1 sterol desaturase family protein [Psychroserpens sp.]MBO6750485.1 sterol desaturase family protein [Psychroserpens sp.]